MKISNHEKIISGYSFLIVWLFFTVLLLSSVPLHAGEPVGWEDLGLHGGQINAIAIDPVEPDTIYAGAYYGDGLFKSTNGGTSWQTVDGFRNELIKSISFDPGDHNTIWIATFGRIYKSENRGLTWGEKFSWSRNNRYFESLAIDPLNSNIIYAGASGTGGSYDDGGEYWQETSLIADHSVVSIAVNPQDRQEIWAATGPAEALSGSIYRSRDGGNTWSKINTNTDEGWFYIIVISPQDPKIVLVGGEKGIHLTKDGGITWTLWYVEDDSCRALALDSQNPDIIYANWGYKFSKSTDGGDSWPLHSISPLNFLYLTIDPRNSQVLYGGDVRLGLYKSIDGGQNWQPINQGIKANQVRASASSPRGKILAGTLSGVYLKNGGGNWAWLSSDQTYSVTFSPEDENTIYAGFGWELGKSTDSGQNWSYVDITSYTDPHRVSSISIYPQNPATIYLGVYYSCGCYGEIYKSTDGGESINLVGYASVPVNTVRVNPINPQIVYAGTGMFYTPVEPGGIYKSIDGGGTWEELSSELVVNGLALDPENPGIIYAACGGSNGFYSGLFKSTDGGGTWDKKDFGIPVGAPEYSVIVDIEIDPDNSNILYAATDRDGIYISHDAGNYWTRLGLSDYWIYDILVSSSSTTASIIKKINGKTSTETSSNLYAGSGSGVLEYNGSGIGIITGMVTDAKTGAEITGASLTTDTGGTALSLTGSYIMVVPAGQCTVSVSIEGYQLSSLSGVVVTGGEETTLDLSLMPLLSLNVSSLETNLSGPPASGDNVQITFTASAQSQSNVYYKWYSRSGIGTANLGSWQILADWTMNNNALTWSPGSVNRYLVLAWVADTANSANFHQIGLIFETQGNSSNPIQITGMTTNITYPQSSGTPITLQTTATGGSGQLYYKYFYRLGSGGWNELGGWSTSGSATWTPSQAGVYTIVVHVSDDNTLSQNPLNQAGMTCTIGE